MNLSTAPNGIIELPGIYQGIAPADYHSDCCRHPSASSSILRTILDESPLHAKYRHPRLNPRSATRDPSQAMDIGSVAHKLVLGVGAGIASLDYVDYRTKAAQQAKQDALEAGQLPVLAHQLAAVERLAKPMRAAVERITGVPIAECLREVVVAWRCAESGHWRRAMLDLVTPDLLLVLDLKTTRMSASPAICTRHIYNGGYDLQRAFYLQGLDAVHPEGRGRRRFGFVYGEQIAPHGVCGPVWVSEEGHYLAAEKLKQALATWDECLSSNTWPGYDGEVIAEPPAWVVSKFNDEVSMED